MAITLGEIAVRLTANTAEFVSGFGHAGTTAKRFRADLSEHIGAVGEVLERGLAQFGEFGESVGGILGRASSAAGTALLSFGKLGGSMGTIVGAGAGVAAGIAVAEAGIIGIAIHSAESAAKLGEMSEKAGVSSQTFAGLALAGKGVGVESESLVKALAFMGANAVKAAISADYAHTAFGRLGIQVKDSAGHMKEGGALFQEVVGKISNLPTSEQGFFVKAIFGRGGIEILPLINLGLDKLAEKMEFARSIGLGDSETVATARQFKETTDEIGAEFEAMGLRLAKDLLPTLNEIVLKIEEWGKSGKLQSFIDELATIVRLTLAGVAAIFDLGRAAATLAKGAFGKESLASSVSEGFDKGGMGGAWEAAKKRLAFDEINSAAKDVSDIFADNGGWSGGASHMPKPTGGGGADLSSAKEDTVLDRLKERLAALQQSRFDWEETARAASLSETLIGQATQKANEEFKKQQEFAAKSKNPAAMAVVEQNEAMIKFQAASIFYNQQLVEIEKSLGKQSLALDEADKATLALADAYDKGGAAIVNAQIDKQFAKEHAGINALNGLAQTAAAQAELDANKAKAKKAASDELTASLKDQAASLRALAPAVNAVSAAYLINDDAVRASRVEMQLAQFVQDQLDKKVSVTPEQKIAKRAELTAEDQKAYNLALAQESVQFNLNAQYDNTIVRLQRIADLMQKAGVSTLGVEAQIFDEQNRLIHQWDEWAGKVGTFKQKFQSVMGELVLQGRNAGEAIRNAFITAIDGVETQLAKLLTGQKADFKGVFQGLAESVTKAEIQKGVGKLAEHFGFHLPGKADGSDTNPFYVILKNGAGSNTIGPSRTIPIFGGTSIDQTGAGGGSGIGGFFSGLFGSLFGGAHAGGGSIPSGKFGIVGERGPEIAWGPANIVPAGPTYNITHNHNYPTAGSRDMWGRTQKQNQRQQARNMRMAYGI